MKAGGSRCRAAFSPDDISGCFRVSRFSPGDLLRGYFRQSGDEISPKPPVAHPIAAVGEL